MGTINVLITLCVMGPQSVMISPQSISKPHSAELPRNRFVNFEFFTRPAIEQQARWLSGSGGRRLSDDRFEGDVAPGLFLPRFFPSSSFLNRSTSHMSSCLSLHSASTTLKSFRIATSTTSGKSNALPNRSSTSFGICSTSDLFMSQVYANRKSQTFASGEKIQFFVPSVERVRGVARHRENRSHLAWWRDDRDSQRFVK